MKSGDKVYVIKYKYDKDKNLIYFIEEMIFSGKNGHYLYCRKPNLSDKHFSSKWIYAQTFSEHRNRVFETFEEAEKSRQFRQKEHDIKKELEKELKKRMEED